MAEHVTEITDAQFDAEVLQSDLPVLVDFWAPWCGPCRMVAPVVAKVAAAQSDSLKVVKVNVDDNPETAGTYGIRSIPTLMVFKAGQKVGEHIGMADEATLTALANAAR